MTKPEGTAATRANLGSLSTENGQVAVLGWQLCAAIKHQADAVRHDQ